MNSQSALSDAALAYTRRGYCVVPIKHREKNPGACYGKGWADARLTETELPKHFNGAPRNVGVLLGEPSGWLIDIDCDHIRAVELAAELLPATPARFGRKSKPRSHYIYQVTGPIATKRWKSRSAGTIIELRSTGGQTVFPPSIHLSGEVIEWDDPDAEPALIDAKTLYAVVERIAEQVKVELGEKVPKKPKPTRQTRAAGDRPANDLERCVRAMLRMQITDSNDGSHRLYAATCRCVEHDLSDGDALIAVRDYERQQPFPSEWSDNDVVTRLRDAKKMTPIAGAARRSSRDLRSGWTILSNASSRMRPPKSMKMKTAKRNRGTNR